MNAISVFPAPRYPAATVEAGGRSRAAVVGPTGVVAAEAKREGDGATPAGTHRLTEVFYRADRVDRPATGLPVREITPTQVWCDDPTHPAYNTLIDDGSFDGPERFWREDHLHDVLVVVGWNADPPVPGRGSAVFVHVARDQRQPAATPTAGCIALARDDLLDALATLGRDAVVRVHLPVDTSAQEVR